MLKPLRFKEQITKIEVIVRSTLILLRDERADGDSVKCEVQCSAEEFFFKRILPIRTRIKPRSDSTEKNCIIVKYNIYFKIKPNYYVLYQQKLYFILKILAALGFDPTTFCIIGRYDTTELHEHTYFTNFFKYK